jgi:hypothetical protein
MDDSVVPLFGTPLWDRLGGAKRAELRYHSQVFNLSQFLHGEQGALICASRCATTTRSSAERREREEFVIAGCLHLRDRFNSPEMWERIGIDPRDALKEVDASDGQTRFRKRLFSRIVPIVKDIGLWSGRVQKAFAEMGVVHYAEFQGIPVRNS